MDQLLVYHELVLLKGQRIRFTSRGSICRKQILTYQHLIILNCVYYWYVLYTKQNPHTLVRSINNTCRTFYSMYCMDVGTGCPTKHDNSKTIWKSSLNFNFFVTFSCQPTLTYMILETITTKFSWSWHFQNVVCLFWAVNIIGDIMNFVQISILLNTHQNCRNMNKIYHISGNIESLKNADHILEILGLIAPLPMNTPLMDIQINMMTW